MNVRDLTGQKFGKLTVLSRAESKISGGQHKVMWLCRCECGAEVTYWASSLKNNKCTSCGCFRRNDLTGRRFGRLVVIEFAGVKKSNTFWLCKCDCGELVTKKGKYLCSGSTRSCGCLSDDSKRERSTTHGMSRTRIYKVWNNMKNRCGNSKVQEYKYYGARGIGVCPEWKDDFEAFYVWSISHGYSANLTIDRIDVNGNYEPDNCRWITVSEQNRNKRNNVNLTYKGETKTLTEWGRIKGIHTETLRQRLGKLGWTVEKALETPVKECNRRNRKG